MKYFRCRSLCSRPGCRIVQPYASLNKSHAFNITFVSLCHGSFYDNVNLASSSFVFFLLCDADFGIGKSSLDARLGSSRLCREILNLLEELQESLQYIVDPSEILGEDDTAEDTQEMFVEMIESVSMTITNLLKLSSLVRQNPTRDPWKRILSLPAWPPGPMIDNASQKWPKLKANPDLLRRLGIANSRRRQFFRYREEHMEKQSQPLRDDDKTLAETDPTTFVGDETST